MLILMVMEALLSLELWKDALFSILLLLKIFLPRLQLTNMIIYYLLLWKRMVLQLEVEYLFGISMKLFYMMKDKRIAMAFGLVILMRIL